MIPNDTKTAFDNYQTQFDSAQPASDGSPFFPEDGIHSSILTDILFNKTEFRCKTGLQLPANSVQFCFELNDDPDVAEGAPWRGRSFILPTEPTSVPEEDKWRADRDLARLKGHLSKTLGKNGQFNLFSALQELSTLIEGDTAVEVTVLVQSGKGEGGQRRFPTEYIQDRLSGPAD